VLPREILLTRWAVVRDGSLATPELIQPDLYAAFDAHVEPVRRVDADRVRTRSDRLRTVLQSQQPDRPPIRLLHPSFVFRVASANLRP
jgi:hypothetical protein